MNCISPERAAGCVVTSDTEAHLIVTVNEMPEVNEANPPSSSSSSAKDAKVGKRYRNIS